MDKGRPRRSYYTANVSRPEWAVGAGIQQSGIKREKLFITSKLWVDDSGYESTKKAFETSLNKLGLEYLDLYLIHRPRGDVKGTWKAMEELYDQHLLSVFVEGGASLHKAFLESGLWDEARVFTGKMAFTQGVKAPKMNKTPLETLYISDTKLELYRNKNVN